MHHPGILEKKQGGAGIGAFFILENKGFVPPESPGSGGPYREPLGPGDF